MNIIVLGLNHRSAPIEIRERLAFSPPRLNEALMALKGYASIDEGLILSTCNRVEIYTAVKDIPSSAADLRNFISRFHKVEPAYFAQHIYLFNNLKAAGHLFKVVSSLDSMVIGETQILGQVKEAYFRAKQAGAAGKILSRLFEEAIRVGKKARSSTQIGLGAVSISSASIELAKKIFTSLKDKKILIIGAGKIAELAAENLYSKGARTVLVANRTFIKAQELARTFQGMAVKFKDILQHIQDADILISSTSAPHYLIKKEQILEVMQKRQNRSLFLIDLGLPRNISPAVKEIDNVYLYNIDDLSGVCDANIQERLCEVRKVEQIIASHVERAAKKLFAAEREMLNEKDHCRRPGQPAFSCPGRRSYPPIKKEIPGIYIFP